ncbi:FKBP-type peptidyl-prolyl cis-trans isomerase [Salinimicrobium soli]|uniref:FKBP-type peptidyl-prolyl cis-trans isomerase n=1 Tax=Salinimicrobium soli TaxID=1254399 RepID=UPI003AAF4367
MRLNKYLFASLILAVALFSCNKEDDGPVTVPERDRSEQEATDQEVLLEYLQTHFYNYEDFENPSESFDYQVRIDTINEANADKTPLIESNLLETKTVTWEGVDYTMYILKVREGVKDQPKFTDSTLVSYRGELLNQTMFDSSITPVWFDLTAVIPGFGRALTEFKGSSGFQVQPDNTVVWNNDYGIGAVFMTSGLGYFARPQAGISPYSPLVFTFNLYGVNEADHDRDGIPSWMEDLNEDMIIANDDTDKDGTSNYADNDDDNDFIPTREEITINEDGSISFPDKDNDGIPDYLDKDN